MVGRWLDDDGARDPGSLQTPLQWNWVDESIAEFFALPELAQGELLVRMQRLLNGESRPGDTVAAQQGLLVMVIIVGQTRHRIVFAATSGGHYAGLLCFSSDSKDLGQADLERALQRRSSQIFPG